MMIFGNPRRWSPWGQTDPLGTRASPPQDGQERLPQARPARGHPHLHALCGSQAQDVLGQGAPALRKDRRPQVRRS